jgi:hypothetical protein
MSASPLPNTAKEYQLMIMESIRKPTNLAEIGDYVNRFYSNKDLG